MRLSLAAMFIASAAFADGGVFAGRDVIFLGEQHDNPAHHARQADLVAEIAPRALVFEMLTEEQAGRVTPELVGDEAGLEATLGWNDSGWPDFAMYYPIFAAAPDAQVFGAAVPREAARSAMETGGAAAFAGDATRFGLTEALLPEDQERREDLQRAAHCDALPEELLPSMVEIQRLRDAELARVALAALEASGGPVVVITGNGHARLDWGAPAVLKRAAPEVSVASFGQGETGSGDPDGGFDLVEIAPDVDRGDPCEAFR
ncbi:ChaN family lipoprotein [Litorisediminicola beolgyonensis]|uniref:ChaN family lipoprotein n=1 Tax=Litorisediminicola beolgyonensis TaxID=1173614 RepID=A0ABW3ZFC0_9RHOB